MFLTLGLPGESIRVLVRDAFRTIFAVICMGFKRFLVFLLVFWLFFAVIYMGFKELLFFCSTVQYFVSMTFKNWSKINTFFANVNTSHL